MSIRYRRIKNQLAQFSGGKDIVHSNVQGKAGSSWGKDLIVFSARINNGIIEDIGFRAKGNDYAIASASYIASIAKGMDLFKGASIGPETLEEYFGPCPLQERQWVDLVIDSFSAMLGNYLSKADQQIFPLNKNRAAVAVSGGIDSSAAALLLKETGVDVFGVTIIVLESKGDSGKSLPREVRLAKRVCRSLGIPHFILDLKDAFAKTIVKDFFSRYMEGITPNPCVECNKYIKFGLLLEKVKMLGAYQIASGHYCRKEKDGNGGFVLKKGIDSKKDQSYMLWRLSQKQLKHINFPLGSCRKQQIREMAARHFPYLANRPESQDICFMDGQSYQKILAQRYGIKEGEIINEKNQVLGKHKGFAFYTIGQRKGLGISHTSPLYVKKIIPSQNRIVVGQKEELLGTDFALKDINFIGGKPPAKTFRADVMIRYNFEPAPAVINIIDEENAQCRFQQAQLAITPGQSAVFYKKDLLLGGGIIV